MLKFTRNRRGEKGYTLIELLIVCAIIGIILAIAIPNLIKARISANEANGRKAMQTLRDAEAEFFEQDSDNNGKRDFTNFIGGNDPDDCFDDNSLRCPDDSNPGGTPCNEQDALVDNSFCGALSNQDGDSGTTGACPDSKAGYCVGWTEDNGGVAGGADIAGSSYGSNVLEADFGWEGTMTSALKNGRRDFGAWGDGVIRCSATTQGTGTAGNYEASRDGTGALVAGACD